MARYIDAELIEKHIKREEHYTPDEKWRPESEFAALVDNIPTADVVEVVKCTECAMHSNCIMEDTFITVGITDGYCRVGRKVEKMTGTDICDIESARLTGQNEAWELARKMTCQPINGGFKRSEFEEIFGDSYISDIFKKYTYYEAATKVAEWEKAKEEVKDGDVLEGI